jgi:hypothetical protein
VGHDAHATAAAPPALESGTADADRQSSAKGDGA